MAALSFASAAALSFALAAALSFAPAAAALSFAPSHERQGRRRWPRRRGPARRAGARVRSIPGLRLAAVSASTEESGRSKLRSLARQACRAGRRAIGAEADVVVEGLPPSEFLAVAEPTLRAGRTLVALSVTQILRHPSSRRSPGCGGRIVVPTGALIGLDAVRAAAEGGHIRSVVMRTKKPPKSLQNAPFVKEQNLDLSSLEEPLRLYEGPCARRRSSSPRT
ncbi:serine-type peptidase [Aureococcus anophagefferens]|nr:serine-type peptidase [Aureococcus anophagefferens]